MMRSCTRSLVRVTCLAALLSLGSAALSFADPDPTGGFQGVPDEIQTRLPSQPTDPAGKKYNAPSNGVKKGDKSVTTTAAKNAVVFDLMIRAWQTQIRFMIQH